MINTSNHQEQRQVVVPQANLSDLDLARVELKSSFLTFIKTFYKLQTGREFVIPSPPGRESHYIIVARELKKVFLGETKRLIINVPPRYGKTTLLVYFMAYCYANYGDCNFIYASYAKSLAAEQTQLLRSIISSRYFTDVFGLSISQDTSARDKFRTSCDGLCLASGIGGSITGFGAGIQGVDRFGGCIVIDDPIKPTEASSDTIRGEVNNSYHNTLASRVNDSTNTPVVLICQRTHEDDLTANLAELGDWKHVSLPAIDDAGNALDTTKHTAQQLLKIKSNSDYVFAAQYQQNPVPAGGGLFKRDEFNLLDVEPEMISSFITADTAETDKTYNDATVFSFFGIYKAVVRGVDLGVYCLHWIDCHEIRVEPKDLENEFLNFYADCMRYKVRPGVAIIEKKSTGVTLASSLRRVPGLRVIALDRNVSSGSKTQRFIDCQPFVSSSRISLSRNARHTEMCLEHMSKITANNTHRHDDIADTLQTAIQCALIDGSLLPIENSTFNDDFAQMLIGDMTRTNQARARTR